VCHSVWMLDDFTAENGATRMCLALIPGAACPNPATSARCPAKRSSPVLSHYVTTTFSSLSFTWMNLRRAPPLT
jgi:hypothetical protein